METRIHLIGMCGTAMATLAAHAQEQGLRRPRLGPERLSADERLPRAAEDHDCSQGYDAEHITADLDLVVVGNAISRGNPELEEVLDRKIRYCSLPEAIRDHFLWGARSVVIAGTHGKTTTTSLTGWLLTHGGADPSVLIGGIADNFDGSYRVGGGREFVIEGDEYDSAFFDKTAKFLKYLPDIAVVNNVEYDHADIYPDLDVDPPGVPALRQPDPAARPAARSAPTTPRRWRCGAQAHCRVETFGLSDGADWQAHDLRGRARARRAFSVRRAGEPIGTFEVPLLGAYNVRNALAAIAVGAAVGLTPTRWPTGCARSRASAAACSCAARRAASRCTTTSRTIRPRSRRRWPASARPIPTAASGRSSSRARRRRAARSSRPTSRARFARGRSRRSCRQSSARRCRRTSGCRPEELVADLKAAGKDARYIPQVDDIVAHVAREARDGRSRRRHVERRVRRHPPEAADARSRRERC